MAKPKFPLWLLAILVVGAFFLMNTGREGVLEDNFIVYDDFNTVLAAGSVPDTEGLSEWDKYMALGYGEILAYDTEAKCQNDYVYVQSKPISQDYHNRDSGCVFESDGTCFDSRNSPGKFTVLCRQDHMPDRSGNQGAPHLWDVENYIVNSWRPTYGTEPLEPLDLTGGKLLLRDQEVYTLSNYPFPRYRLNSITSTKEFTTEDIKISLYMKEFSPREGWNNERDCVWFGDQQLPIWDNIPWTTLFGGDQIREWEGVMEIKRYDDLDLSKYVFLRDGIEIATFVQPGPAKLKFQGWLDIDSVTYSPYYSCEIDYENEVVVRDKFVGGQNINIEDLKYTPTKFCPQDLGVLIFSDEGFTDEKGSITQALAQGETLTVPTSQYWQIDYVTKYVNDMTERCGVGEAYDTEARQCVSVSSQQIPTPTLLYCEQESDCLLPQKCDDAIVSCVENQCNYASAICTPDEIINEVLVEKTIELETPVIVEIKTSGNQVAVTHNYELQQTKILGKQFISGTPTFLCGEGSGRDDYSGYNRQAGCYEVAINWGDFSGFVKNGETITLGNIADIKYDMTARGVYNGTRTRVVDGEDVETEYRHQYVDPDDWASTFVIDVNNVFDVVEMNYEERQELNEGGDRTLTITNNLWDLPDSGYYISIDKDLRDVQSEFEAKPLSLPSGTTNVDIALPADELGVYVVKLVPFTPILGEQEYLSHQATAGYYVYKDLPNQPQSTGCTSDSDCYTGTCTNSICYVTVRQTDPGSAGQSINANSVGDLFNSREESTGSPLTFVGTLWAVAIAAFIYFEVIKKRRKNKRRKRR